MCLRRWIKILFVISGGHNFAQSALATVNVTSEGRGEKVRRTLPASNPPSGRQATRVGTFAPELCPACSRLFFGCVLPPALRKEPRLLFKLLAAAGGGMITEWSVIALSHQHPTCSRPTWSRMAPRLYGGPLPGTHPPTLASDTMSFIGDGDNGQANWLWETLQMR